MRNWAQAEISQEFNQTEPAGDIMPRAYMLAGSQLTVAMYRGDVMLSQAGKAHLFGEILPGLIRRGRCSAFAVTFTTYGQFHKSLANLTAAELDAVERGEIPDGWPARKRWRKPEEQMLILLDADGAEELWWAEIVRPHRHQPILGYWATRPDAASRGGIFDEVRLALQETRLGASPRPSGL